MAAKPTKDKQRNNWATILFETENISFEQKTGPRQIITQSYSLPPGLKGRESKEIWINYEIRYHWRYIQKTKWDNSREQSYLREINLVPDYHTLTYPKGKKY